MTMTIDDDSLLSAYMDGQLSPEQQLAVESALVSDPHLGEELRSLTLVRDLLAGLPRDASVDLASRVMSRISGRSRLGMILSAVPGQAAIRQHPSRVAGLLAIAAGLLMAAMMTFTFRVGPGAVRGQAGPQVAKTDPSSMLPVPSVDSPLHAAESGWPLFVSHPNREGASSQVEPKDHLQGDSHRATPRSGELEHVSQYLDNPDLRRIFLVSDVMDDSEQQQVASVVEQTTRFNFYKITIAQGIVLDPRHPSEATVFALVVNPNELITLRDRLRKAVHDRVEETPIDPKVVTQLADIGHVQACPPSPMADVEIPRESLALLVPKPGADEQPPAPQVAPQDPAHPRRPTPEQERSSPAAELASAKSKSGARVTASHPGDLAALKADRDESQARPGPGVERDESFVVLVWVSRSRPS